MGFLGVLERTIGENPACIYVAMENRLTQVLHTHQPLRMSVNVSQSGHLGPWSHHVLSPKVPPVPRAVWCLNDREPPIRGGGLDGIPLLNLIQPRGAETQLRSPALGASVPLGMLWVRGSVSRKPWGREED